MLHNTTWLKKTWHESKVSTSVHQSSICEEFLRGCPEAIWILVLEMPHPIGTLSRVRITHVAWSSHQELNFLIILLNDYLSHVQDQVNSLLLCDPTYEREEWHRIIEITIVEVLDLQEPLCCDMIRRHCI